MFAFIAKGEGLLLVPVPKREELAGLAQGAKAKGFRDSPPPCRRRRSAPATSWRRRMPLFTPPPWRTAQRC